jgi:hypothetical protein
MGSDIRLQVLELIRSGTTTVIDHRIDAIAGHPASTTRASRIEHSSATTTVMWRRRPAGRGGENI